MPRVRFLKAMLGFGGHAHILCNSRGSDIDVLRLYLLAFSAVM
jgi:hypothetical protein